jgi:hypothetical protein
LLVAIATAPTITVAARSVMIRRLFPDFSLLRLSARPVAVAASAVALTTAISALPFGGVLLARIACFFGVAIVAALLLDGETVRDAMWQVRGAAAGS